MTCGANARPTSSKLCASLARQSLTVGDPTAMDHPQWHADRQVNARNRFARKILRCKNHQIRPAAIEIVSIGYDIAFVFAGAERHGNKYGFARRAPLETVLLDSAPFKVVLEQ